MPKSSRDGAHICFVLKKAPRVSSNKRGSQYCDRGKHFNFKNPFLCDSIFSSSTPFQKTLSKITEKVFLTLFWTIL
jgi:hypothetical protein